MFARFAPKWIILGLMAMASGTQALAEKGPSVSDADLNAALDFSWVHLMSPAKVPLDGGSFQEAFRWRLQGGVKPLFLSFSGAGAAWKREETDTSILKLDSLELEAGARAQLSRPEFDTHFHLALGLMNPISWNRDNDAFYQGLRAFGATDLTVTVKTLPLLSPFVRVGGRYTDVMLPAGKLEIDADSIESKKGSHWEIHGGGGLGLGSLLSAYALIGKYHFTSGRVKTSMATIAIEQPDVDYLALGSQIFVLGDVGALTFEATRLLGAAPVPASFQILAGQRTLPNARSGFSLGFAMEN